MSYYQTTADCCCCCCGQLRPRVSDIFTVSSRLFGVSPRHFIDRRQCRPLYTCNYVLIDYGKISARWRVSEKIDRYFVRFFKFFRTKFFLVNKKWMPFFIWSFLGKNTLVFLVLPNFLCLTLSSNTSVCCYNQYIFTSVYLSIYPSN